MQDFNSEILKLKALINNKHNTSIFANKANDAEQIVHDGYKIYVNDMTKKFTFTTANTINQITIDPKTKTIDNVEYLNDLKVSDIKTFKQDLDAEIEARIAGDAELEESKADKVHTHNISDVTDLSNTLNNKANKQELDAEIEARIAGDAELEESKADINHVHEGMVIDNYQTWNDDNTEIHYLKIRQKTNPYIQIMKWYVNNNDKIVRSTLKENSLYLESYLDGTKTCKYTAEGLEFEDGTKITKDIATHNHDDRYALINHVHNVWGSKTYSTIADMYADWNNIPNNTIIECSTGPEGYTAVITFRANANRSLTFGLNKQASDHLWINFMYNESWQEARTWRKIPVLTSDNNLNLTGNIIANGLTLNGSSKTGTTWVTFIQAMKSDLGNNQIYQILFGKAASGLNSGYIGYHYSTTDPKMTIGLYQNVHIATFGNTVNINKPLVTETLTAKTLNTSINTTSAIGSNLKKALVDIFYPVGSIYTSMNNTSPATLFGGTWSQITDRFLYCVSSNSNTTGGSKKITIDNLPSHNHGIDNVYDDANFNHGNTSVLTWSSRMSIPNDTNDTESAIKYRRTTYTNNTGSGTDYMPPYITVYAWYRTA